MITPPQQASSLSLRFIFKIFGDRQTAFKENNYDKLSLFVFIQHDPGKLRGL
jgi:hypothetical protein